MQLQLYIYNICCLISVVLAANFAHYEKIPITAPLILSAAVPTKITQFDRIIQIDSDCSVLYVSFSIPAYGHSTQGTRSRIWLELNGVVMSDGTKFTTNAVEAKPITLTGMLTNIPANSNINLRVIIQNERESGIFQTSDPNFQMFASISAFGLSY